MTGTLQQGIEVLRDPALNKSTAFTEVEPQLEALRGALG